jgi:hypothetical protein
VFILYAVVAGIVLGYLVGGRLDRLARLRIRAWPIALAGLAVQLVLFSSAGESLPADLVPAVYLLSTVAVLVVVLLNLRIPGLALVAIGAFSNLAAILANGGRMPVDAEVLASLGKDLDGGPTNSVVVADPALRPLTDIIALPAWLPFANVISIGDVLIGLGIAIAIVAGMRGVGPPLEVPEPIR